MGDIKHPDEYDPGDEQDDQEPRRTALSIKVEVFSMTPQERTNPELMNMSRKQRIAGGRGT